MWTWFGVQLHTSTCSGGSWQGYSAVVSEDAVDDASLVWMGSDLWAIYGRRDTDLQWDLWACTPDPTGVAQGPELLGPDQLSLSVQGSNPFSGSVVLMIGAPASTSLRIYDLGGRSVLERTVEPGLFTWDGRSGSGIPVPSGVYFAVAGQGRSTESVRLVRI